MCYAPVPRKKPSRRRKLRRHQQILVFRWCVWCCCRQSRNNDTAAGLISDYSKSLISPQFVTASDACGFWASTWIAHNLCSVLATVYLRVSEYTNCRSNLNGFVGWSVNLNFLIITHTLAKCEVWWRQPHQHSMVAQNQSWWRRSFLLQRSTPYSCPHFPWNHSSMTKQWAPKTHLCSDIKLSAS